MLYKSPQPKIEFQKFTEEDYMPVRHEGLATIAVHSGQKPEEIRGRVRFPIKIPSGDSQREMNQPYGQFGYTMAGNPTRYALQECLKAMEYGEHCITFASGCGAMAAIMHTLKTGDHIVVCDDVYGGTNRYLRLFMKGKFGMKVDFIDMTNLEIVKKHVNEKTKLIWVESPTNPTMKLIDLVGIVKIAKDSNSLVVVDNTFSSPVIQSPILLGIDIVFHSCSKFIAGHSDVVMGALIIKDEEVYKKVYQASCSIGANPSLFDSFLVLRSLKTLEQRVYKCTKNAFHIAHFLERNQNIDNVLYPGLKSNPHHELAKKQMRGFGGIISFRIKGGKEQVSKFMKAIKIFTLAVSLGGVDSLAQCPFFMSHAKVPEEQRKILGITDNLIRLSCGVECTEDLVADVDQALKFSQKDLEGQD